jgi:hypothetical protein
MRMLVRTCLSATVLAVATASLPMVAGAQDADGPQRDFQVAVTLIEDYRTDILDLQTEVVDAPHLALPVMFDRTIEAMKVHRGVDVDACFAEWWAHEYVSLKLGAMFALYMQESSTDQVKVDHTGWLADRFHQDAQKMRTDTFEACA